MDPASGPDIVMSPDTGPGPSPGTVMVRGTPSTPNMTCHDTGPDMTDHAVVTPPDASRRNDRSRSDASRPPARSSHDERSRHGDLTSPPYERPRHGELSKTTNFI